MSEINFEEILPVLLATMQFCPMCGTLLAYAGDGEIRFCATHGDLKVVCNDNSGIDVVMEISRSIWITLVTEET